MQKFSTLLFVLACALLLVDTGMAQTKAWYRLYLKDKAGADYCALSERAMQRRTRQNLALDSTDVCVSPLYINELRAQGWQVVTTSRWLNTVVVVSGGEATVGEESLRRCPFIARYDSIAGPADAPLLTASKQRKELRRPAVQVAADNFRVPMYEVRGEALYDAGFRGQGILVSVLDAGFLKLDQNPCLKEKVDGWYDCYAPSDTTGETLWSASNHGAMALSAMAADSIYGIWGTAPEARYFVIRTEWSDTETPLEEDMWVRGAEIADSIGADLINSSLGYSSFDDATFNHTWSDLLSDDVLVSRGAEIACRKGMLVCCSAGNEGDGAWRKLIFPANVPEVLTVGATDSHLCPAYFTSVGWTEPYVKPDVSARGLGAWVINPDTGNPTRVSGTSFSNPFICGLMASLWSADPTLTPARLRQIVRESSSQLASPDSLVGYGIPDFGKALLAVRPEWTGLESLTIDEGTSDTYNLQGQKTDCHGLRIRRRRVVFVR